MRREHQRRLAAQGLRMGLGRARAYAHHGVEGVGVQHQAHLGAQQGAHHLARPQGRGHARPRQHRVDVLEKPLHVLGRLHRKRALGVDRQAHHGDGEQVRLGHAHHRRGDGQGHVARARARRGQGRHDRGARVARGARHHEHAAAGVLVLQRVGLGQHVQVVALVEHEGGGRVGDVLQALLVAHQARHHDLAAGLPAHPAHQAGLGGEHGHGHVGREVLARDHAGGGVDAAGHVDTHDLPRAHLVHHARPGHVRLGELAGEARPEARVDHDVRGQQELLELLYARVHVHRHAHLGGAQGDAAGQLAVHDGGGCRAHRRRPRSRDAPGCRPRPTRRRRCCPCRTAPRPSRPAPGGRPASPRRRPHGASARCRASPSPRGPARTRARRPHSLPAASMHHPFRDPGRPEAPWPA